MSQRPDIEEDFHTEISLSFCELRKRKSQQQLVITCDTQTSTQQKNSFEKSRGIEKQKKNKQPHEIVLHSSSFFHLLLPFMLIFFFLLGFEQKKHVVDAMQIQKKRSKSCFYQTSFFFFFLQHSDSDFKSARESCERQKGEEF